ncbi:hypothetical protein RRG08_053957 [Elysia crispata]|uniref:Uncharacterized protein n=1 Tax=Elysia crispata TaxID=231223 RepID=A0AAE0ZE89_9GAST|nr:hypothetical protein RRG08_053957 [Elysia crispata]
MGVPVAPLKLMVQSKYLGRPNSLVSKLYPPQAKDSQFGWCDRQRVMNPARLQPSICSLLRTTPRARFRTGPENGEGLLVESGLRRDNCQHKSSAD